MPGHPLEAALLTRTSTGAPTEAGSHVSAVDSTHSTRSSLVVAAGGLEHLRRRVDADDPGVRPAVREAERQRAVATTQVHDDHGVGRRHSGQQVGEGPAEKEPNRAYCCGSQAIRPSSLDADILTSRYLTTSRLRKVTALPAPSGDEVDRIVVAGRANGRTSTSRPPGAVARLGWRVTSTWPGGRRSRSGDWSCGSSTSSPRCGGRAAVPALPRHLVSQTLVTSGTMTNRVDRLTARGLVERSPDPNDRRGVIVALTDAGRETVDAALADLLSRERQLLSRLSERDRSTLAALLRELLEPFDA